MRLEPNGAALTVPNDVSLAPPHGTRGWEGRNGARCFFLYAVTIMVWHSFVYIYIYIYIAHEHGARCFFLYAVTIMVWHSFVYIYIYRRLSQLSRTQTAQCGPNQRISRPVVIVPPPWHNISTLCGIGSIASCFRAKTITILFL